MCITGYTCADIFYQNLLYESAFKSLFSIAENTAFTEALIAVGLPVLFSGRLYNCAALIQKGEILGIVPKTYIPNHNEFYERRWFSSGADITNSFIEAGNRDIPFGTDLLFKVSGKKSFTLGIELCEDMWAPVPPSVRKSLAGAEIILNLSASNELAGKG